MNGFLKSFQPILKKLKKYRLEILILSLALVTTLVSAAIFLVSSSQVPEEILTETTNQPKDGQKSLDRILIEFSGAVENPGVYEVTAGARLKDGLVLANGLSADADRPFFGRNFNLARVLSDQEKIYIPSTEEINAGLFAEAPRTLDYLTQTNAVSSSNTETKININTADLEELDQLPGVGRVTATKIIDNRPYQTIDDLQTKKVVNKSVFEKIKNLIAL